MRALSEGDGAGENKERAGAATDGPMFPADEKETLKKEGEKIIHMRGEREEKSGRSKEERDKTEECKREEERMSRREEEGKREEQRRVKF